MADSPVLTIHDVPTTSNFQLVPPVPPFSLAEEANPWLIEAGSSSSKVARRKNELLVGRDVTRAQKSETALQKHMKKSTASREQENEDAVIELKPDDVLVVSNTKSSGASKPEGIKKKEKKKKLNFVVARLIFCSLLKVAFCSFFLHTHSRPYPHFFSFIVFHPPFYDYRSLFVAVAAATAALIATAAAL